jgi:hypothetical protein
VRFYVVLLALVAVTACGGGPSAEEKARERTKQAEILAGEVRARQAAAASKQASANLESCRSQLEELTVGLREIDSRLDVGLNYEEYSDKVSDASVADGRIDIGSLPTSDCLLPLGLAKTALRSYIDAQDVWQNCVEDPECNSDSIDSQLQKHWADASSKIASLGGAFRRLGRPPKPPTIEMVVPKYTYAVTRSVYGRALTTVCATRKPRGIIEPCAELKAIVSGGVKDDELGELDDAVQKLNVALGLTSPDES